MLLPGANGKVDLAVMLRDLAQREINELHVEAGEKLNGSLIREGLVDEFVVYLAPKLIGQGRGMAHFGPLQDLAQAVLTLGASRAFRCSAALRPSLDDGESAVKWALRLGALATVSHQTDSYQRWWEVRTGVAETVRKASQSLEKESWEPYASSSQ